MIPEYIGIHCRCGHFAPLEEFIVDEDGNALPMDHFLCPACRSKFHRHHEPGRMADVASRRRWLPGKTTIKRTPEPWETTPMGRMAEKRHA